MQPGALWPDQNRQRWQAQRPQPASPVMVSPPAGARASTASSSAEADRASAMPARSALALRIGRIEGLFGHGHAGAHRTEPGLSRLQDGPVSASSRSAASSLRRTSASCRIASWRALGRSIIRSCQPAADREPGGLRAANLCSWGIAAARPRWHRYRRAPMPHFAGVFAVPELDYIVLAD